MNKIPDSIINKLQIRKEFNVFRQLSVSDDKIDFSSNDYLGLSRSEAIFHSAYQYLTNHNLIQNGATGSRLLSGNYSLYIEAETFIADFHNTTAALLFNSGYDANVGFFSSVPQRGDIILYDALIHASIRDGIQLSHAKAYKFEHNDFEDLENILHRNPDKTIYIVTESVFSMDGDSPNLEELVRLSEKYNCYLVVDEAHALGVFGDKGEGLVQFLHLEERIFARIMTFGKGLGCHGAAILGSEELKDYLINFARSFIYTTGLPPHSIATILKAYQYLDTFDIKDSPLTRLKENIIAFKQETKMQYLSPVFVRSNSAVHCIIIPGNEKVKGISTVLQSKGFDVKPIVSPTVPEGQERLRFCLHSYNTKEEIMQVLQELSDKINS